MNLIVSLAKKQSKKATFMYNQGIKSLKLDLIYKGLSVKDLRKAIESLKTSKVLGFTVSMPFKEEVKKYVDKISKDAEDIGAINTIVKKENFYIGYNTDWMGAITSLKKKINLKSKKIILIGAGGVAKAIAYGLYKEKCKVIIFNRTLKKAETLAKKYKFKFDNLKNINEIKDYDLLINATPLDIIGKRIINESLLRKEKVIMDVIFDPVETKLIKKAKKMKCKVVGGLDMLVYQAIAQFNLFFKKKPSFEILKKAYKNG